MRFGDKLKVNSEPTLGKSYVSAVLEVVDFKPSYDKTGERLHLKVVYANGREAGPFHGWENYELEVVELFDPFVNGTRFRAGDRVKLNERGAFFGSEKYGRVVGALATILSEAEYHDLASTTRGDAVPYKIDGFPASHCPQDYWDFVNPKTADESEYAKGVHVLCTSSGGDFENDRGVEDGVYYVVKKYYPNDDERLSGLVEVRGVTGKFSTQRFRKATADEVKALVPFKPGEGDIIGEISLTSLDDMFSAIFGRDLGRFNCGGEYVFPNRPAAPRFTFVPVGSGKLDEQILKVLRSKESLTDLFPSLFPPTTVKVGDTVLSLKHPPFTDVVSGDGSGEALPPVNTTDLLRAAGANEATIKERLDGRYDASSARGLRFNNGKRRMDLVPPDALAVLADVYTRGAQKYAERNWEKGMPWSEVISSLERHTLALKAGEDYDVESAQLHAGHIAWNAFALIAYHLRGIGTDDRYVVSVPTAFGADKKDEAPAAPVETAPSQYVVRWRQSCEGGKLLYFAAGINGKADEFTAGVEDKALAARMTAAEASALCARYVTIGAAPEEA